MENETKKPFSPLIIQGGMGVAISTWFLARTVSMLGMLGTVSGVALERVVAIILQLGDPGGHFRRALDHFPYPEVAARIRREFYVEGGVPVGKSLRPCPAFTLEPSRLLIDLTVFANFAAVWLAKEGHNHPISINYLEKIQMPHPYALFGAMLAGIDVVTVGAGIPLQFPQMFQDIVAGKPVRYKVDIIPDPTRNGPHYREIVFDPREHFGWIPEGLKVPRFLPIISSYLLANHLLETLPAGSIYGFVVEEDTAGGHNAPPRKVGGQILYSPSGEPIYGPKDQVDYPKLARLCDKSGIKFWIGGSMASPACLNYAKSVGAAGIQAGSMFALADESGIDLEIKRAVRYHAYREQLKVRTDPLCSPTGFPFKVASLLGTISEDCICQLRDRICDHGALVTLYERPDGSIGYRCPAEPIDDFVAKGGKIEETRGRKCLCNGLLATAGLNRSAHQSEPPIVTLGDMKEGDRFLPHLMRDTDGKPSEFGSYTVADVKKYLLGI